MLNNRAASAASVSFDDKGIHIRLTDGCEISALLEWFPRLYHATNEQRQHWELIRHGVGIHWEEIDEDISVAELLDSHVIDSGDKQ